MLCELAIGTVAILSCAGGYVENRTSTLTALVDRVVERTTGSEPDT